MRVRRVVSGGQTGVDRAALDAASACGVDHGGWCPRGGVAEDAPEPPGVLAAYPSLRETPSADPAERTAWNVRDSDATLVLTLGPLASSPGTRRTVDVARDLGRPHAVLAADDAHAVRAWLRTLPGAVLNVAGPREREQPGVYAEARRTLEEVLAGADPTGPAGAGPAGAGPAGVGPAGTG